MRFSSSFGNQPPATETRVSRHIRGKFQDIFAKNAQMFIAVFRKRNFQQRRYVFGVFLSFLLETLYAVTINQWMAAAPSLQIPKIGCIQLIWSKSAKVPSFRNQNMERRDFGLVGFFICFSETTKRLFWILTQWEKAGPRSESSCCCISWIHIVLLMLQLYVLKWFSLSLFLQAGNIYLFFCYFGHLQI